MSCCEPSVSPLSSGSIGPVLSEMLSVADAAALSAATSVGTQEGTAVFVRTYRAYFVSTNLATPATVAANEVLTHASGGNWRWERMEVPHPTWARQDAWFIYPGAGSDEADGLTSGTAISTFAELARRVGKRWFQRNYGTTNNPALRSIVVQLVGTAVVDEVVTLDILQDRNVTMSLLGVRTLATSTTVNGAPTAQSGNTPGAVTGASWTTASEVGRLIRNVAADSYTWGAKDNGASSLRVGPWVGASQTSAIGIQGGAPAAPVDGGALETYTISQMPNLNLRMGGGNSTRGIIVQDIEFTSYLSIAAVGGQHVFNRCRWSGSTIRFSGGLFGFDNCCFPTNPSAAVGNDSHCVAYFNACVFLSATWTAATSAKRCEVVVTNGSLFQTTSIQMSKVELRTNNTLYGSAALFCDTATEPVQISAGGSLRTSSPLAGTNITGYGVRLTGAARLEVDNAVVNLITGSLGDFCFGRASALPATRTSVISRDPATGLEGTARTLSWTNLAAAYGSGGFGGCANDTVTGCLATIN